MPTQWNKPSYITGNNLVVFCCLLYSTKTNAVYMVIFEGLPFYGKRIVATDHKVEYIVSLCYCFCLKIKILC